MTLQRTKYKWVRGRKEETQEMDLKYNQARNGVTNIPTIEIM